MFKPFGDEHNGDRKLEAGKNFIFPKESSETKKAIDLAEKKINNSVKVFAKNLDAISPWLTAKLLDIFWTLKNKSEFRWLTESDQWLHSLELLYDQNTAIIPYDLETILTEMLKLLTQYKSLRKRSKTLEDMLRACASINSMTPSEKKNYNLGIIPPTSGSRGRQ